MPAVGASAVSVSALVTRNIYEMLVKGRDPGHYVRVGQFMIGLVLTLAILVSLYFESAVDMLKILITFNTYFGAAVLLTFFWRRLTAPAVMIGLVIWVLLIGLIPQAPHFMPGFRRSEPLLLKTDERQVTVTSGATQTDVDAGRAKTVGETITKTHVLQPRSVFFDSVARAVPEDPNSPLEGVGRFHTEIYVLNLVGLPVQRFSPANLVTARWLFAGLFPFAMLILFSLVTRPADPERVQRFYAKMKTPVQADPEQDKREIELSLANPTRFDHHKLFPRSNWEFGKWNRQDALGFLACWGIVVVILSLLVGLLKIGA
jgi:hypothetical protein